MHAAPWSAHFNERDIIFRNQASFTHAAKHTLVKLTILPILDFGVGNYLPTLYSTN